MGKRIQRIKKLQYILTDLLKRINDLSTFAKEEEDKKFKKVLLQYVIEYAMVSFRLNMYLIKQIPKSQKSDIIEEKFNKLMKPLEKEFKKKKKKGK